MNKFSISALTIAAMLTISSSMALAQDKPVTPDPTPVENPLSGTNNNGGNNNNNGGSNGGSSSGGSSTTTGSTGGGSTGSSTSGNTSSGNTSSGNTSGDNNQSGQGVLQPSYDEYVLQPQYNPNFQRIPVNTKIRAARFYKQLNASECGAEAERLASIPASGPILAEIDNSNPIRVVELCPTAFATDGNPELLSKGNIVGLRSIIDRNDALHHALSREGFDADNVVAVARGEDVVYVYVHNAG